MKDTYSKDEALLLLLGGLQSAKVIYLGWGFLLGAVAVGLILGR